MRCTGGRSNKALVSVGFEPKLALDYANGLFPCPAKVRHVSEREHHYFFPCERADVVMQAHYFGARDFPHQLLQEWPGCFDQMASNLFEKIASLFGRKRTDELLFCHSQHARESDHEKIANQVGVDSLRPPAHVVLFELADSFANGCFNFTLCLHRQLGV